MGVSINGGIQNGWFIMEDPIKMDDDWGTLFQETTKCTDPLDFDGFLSKMVNQW